MTETALESSTESTPQVPPTTIENEQEDRSRVARRRWAFLLLALALAWVAVIRIPLILNARHHLDSDLAVDGIVLREAARGHWRWHYPGTPYIGIPPVLFSLPQTWIWGANPATLVSGGAAIYAAVVVATFALAWVAFGRGVALWGLVPLTFASTGVLWLSGRITGGHLLVVAWHAFAFLLFHRALVRGRRRDAAALGVWCGLGLYVDSMFVLTLAGLIPAALGAWWCGGRSRSAVVAVACFGLGFGVGLAPREIGGRVDPYSSYTTPILTDFEPKILLGHLRLLGLDCLPRLITGHRLPDLQADPDPGALGSPAPNQGPRDASPIAVTATVVILLLFLVAVRNLADPASTRGDLAAAAVRWGLLLSGVAALAAFLLYREIYNPDHYRYLVTLLVPWSVGFGLAMRSLVRLGRPGAGVAALCSVAVAVLMTLDAARWYERFGWIDSSGRPVRVAVENPALDWLNRNTWVHSFYSGYWDAYRLTFLADRPVVGIAFPTYPNRFPEWSRDLPNGHPQVVIARRWQMGRQFIDKARAAGGVLLEHGDGYSIFSWP